MPGDVMRSGGSRAGPGGAWRCSRRRRSSWCCGRGIRCRQCSPGWSRSSARTWCCAVAWAGSPSNWPGAARGCWSTSPSACPPTRRTRRWTGTATPPRAWYLGTDPITHELARTLLAGGRHGAVRADPGDPDAAWRAITTSAATPAPDAAVALLAVGLADHLADLAGLARVLTGWRGLVPAGSVLGVAHRAGAVGHPDATDDLAALVTTAGWTPQALAPPVAACLARAAPADPPADPVSSTPACGAVRARLDRLRGGH
ncbi:SAM-dependent methyltransferase [Saccharothrix australiensis]|uniref:S-adenosyl methyltransferase n=1 Tax=Saccharothrix australiensis TaxID=2072 RepID=A0A495W007_9PSEU|nr:SAM-dependent methyltransferase [Saccharothrix australiensis]RKT54113.1 S-adenosyl methyltransferase [Saccharothrix australiensis]